MLPQIEKQTEMISFTDDFNFTQSINEFDFFND